MQNVGTYIVQMTNILGNLERNKKVNIADIAFDRMTADINSKIANVTIPKITNALGRNGPTITNTLGRMVTVVTSAK
jgi:predicted amino acid dehydrogenase